MLWLAQHLNLASLSYSSRLLLVLSILAGASWLVLTAGLYIVGMWSTDANSISFVARWMNARHFAPRARSAINRWIPILSAGIAGYILGAASLFAPIRQLNMVEVVSKDDDRVYTVIIPRDFNYGYVRDIRMTIRLCSDGDDLPLKSGMIMNVFQYVQQSGCLLINASTNVRYLRDQNNNVIDKNGKLLFAKED